MSDGTFERFIDRERARLSAEREAIFSQQQELQTKLAGINREFAAIDAYQTAKTGKAVKAAAPAGTRARRGSKRGELLALIGSVAGGISRGEILERLGFKGDKSNEMSISNALTALTKTGQVTRDGRKYKSA